MKLLLGAVTVIALALPAGLLAWRLGAPAPSEVPQQQAPARIASLTLATDEILAELVPADRIVAVSSLVDDPEISSVAGRYRRDLPRLRETDAERIVALGPDLVCVASYNTADALALLRRSGLSLYVNEACTGIDEIEAGIQALGARVGAEERAQAMVAVMRSRRAALARRLDKVTQRPRVLYWASGFTMGTGTTVDDVIRLAGGRNLAAELGLHGPVEIAPERVVGADPEIVLVPQWSAYDGYGKIEDHAILRNLPAVREGRVVAVPGRSLTSVSQFVMEGAERVAAKLHPERFAIQVTP